MIKKKAIFIGAALFIITIIFLIPFIINIIFFLPYNIDTLLTSISLYMLTPISLYIIFIGLLFIKRAKKFNVQLLKYAGFFLITGFVGNLSSFFAILIYFFTTYSISFQIMGIGAVYLSIILNGMWYPIAVSFAMYIGAELLMPNNKKYFMTILIILLIASELLLFIYPLFFLVGVLADISSLYTGLFFIILLEFYVFVFIYLGVNGFGFLYKSIRTKGTIRKRFLLLSTAFFVDILHFVGDVNSVFLNLIIAIVQPPLLYFGLKQKKPKKVKKEKKKIPSKKAIELASYILRKDALIDKMDDIEEQISSRLDKELTLFISYATKDSDLYRIKEVAKLLDSYKNIKKVLFWEKDMDDNIITYMNENLGKCDVMVLFCSKNTLNSVPVQKEWTAAEIMGKPIIPVFYNTNDIPPLLKSRLGVEFNFYNIQENARNLYNLTLKKYFSL